MLGNEVVFQALAVLEDSFDVELTAALEVIAAVSLIPPVPEQGIVVRTGVLTANPRRRATVLAKPTVPCRPCHSNGNAALHNACMQLPTHRTPVALFVALTRAVREAAVHDDVRIRAYDVIDRMARSVGQPSFGLELDALVALASQHVQIDSALKPFWDDLRALVPKT